MKSMTVSNTEMSLRMAYNFMCIPPAKHMPKWKLKYKRAFSKPSKLNRHLPKSLQTPTVDSNEILIITYSTYFVHKP